MSEPPHVTRDEEILVAFDTATTWKNSLHYSGVQAGFFNSGITILYMNRLTD